MKSGLGIHGGDIETSIMLAHCPASVNMDKAQDFGSLQQELGPRHDAPSRLWSAPVRLDDARPQRSTA
jgi:creatinine amidohydrolase/Fe(II)-dependent formamide hydrolase-like protein